ncbi:MAG: rod shape-determining protein RodA [Patescibacteria group bacterium]
MQNRTILIIVALLNLLGIWTLFSLEPFIEWNNFQSLITSRPVRQIFFLIGAVLVSYVSIIWLELHRKFTWILGLNIVVIILCLVVVIIDREVRGASRWIQIGFFSLQPSEFAKLGTILWCSYLATFRDISKIGDLVAYWLIPFSYFLVVWNSQFGQSDLGTATMIVLPAVVIYLLSQNVPKLHKFALAGTIALGVVFISFNLVGYQQNRLDVLSFIVAHESWLPQNTDQIRKVCNDTTLYNTCHSVALVANNNFFGSLESFETSKTVFLPERQTDFIFASLSHYMGMFASIGLILLYIFLTMSLIRFLKGADPYKFYLLVAVILVLSLQTVINIGMNLGIVPVVGLPLPWVSYGGSQLLMNYLLIFIAISKTTSYKAYELT